MRVGGAWLARMVPLTVVALVISCGNDEGPASPVDGGVGESGSVILRHPELGPVPPAPVWPDDEPTEAKAELGRAIFYDARLSHSGNTSCNNCHVSITWFQDNLPHSVPDRAFPKDTPKTERHTPSLLNLVYAPIFRWDGSHEDLFEVLAFPFSEANMNLGSDVPSAQRALKDKLTKELPGYVARFRDAFDVELTKLEPTEVWRFTGRALAHFLRRAVSRESAFDRYNAGDDDALDDSEKRGLALFMGEARCARCHTGPFFTDYAFHNISTAPLARDGEREDEGRARVTHVAKDAGKFLTPSLRDCYDTAPYFHDGSAGGLKAVVSHFASADSMTDPNHDPLVASPPTLADAQKSDLVHFLKTLRGKRLSLDEIGPPASLP